MGQDDSSRVSSQGRTDQGPKFDLGARIATIRKGFAPCQLPGAIDEERMDEFVTTIARKFK